MIVIYVLIFVVFINSCFYILFSFFSFSKQVQPKSSKPFSVSLIVCAKNEAENLKKFIPFWLEQDHPKFELILINDASTDNTLEVINYYAKKDSRIKIVDVKNNENFWANKKYALTLGIKKASYTCLIFTDADCKPASKKWLRTLSAHFTKEKQVVLGYGAYQKKSGLLNKLIRFETVITALQYFSYAKVGIPYMGVGRNLGYTSNLFYEYNGFSSHMKIASGDDDLFINEVATKSNTALSLSKDSFTYSLPKKKMSKWIFQKRRHITTAKYYKPLHKFLLGLYALFTLLFWTVFTVSLLYNFKIALVVGGFRIAFQYVVFFAINKKLDEKDLIIWTPFFELFLICFQISIFISNKISKPSRWK